MPTASPHKLAAATPLPVLYSELEAARGDLSEHPSYGRALALQTKLAPDSLTVADTLHNLGVVALQEEDPATASRYHRQELTIQERLLPNSLTVASSLTDLGNLALDQGDLAAANDYYLRALVIQAARVPDSLQVAHSLNNLGVVARHQENLETARQLHRQAPHRRLLEHLQRGAVGGDVQAGGGALVHLRGGGGHAGAGAAALR